METQAQVLAYLDKLGIAYGYMQHAKVVTMEDCAALNLPAAHCKNLFLCNRAATEYTLLLIRADKPFVTREVSKTLGVSRLSFGKDDALNAMLHTHPGCVSPMGLLFDSAKPIKLVIDRDLLAQDSIAFHPLTDEASLWMKTEDFLQKFLPATGHTPLFIDISVQ